MTPTDDLLQAHEAELRDLIERTMNGTTAPTEIGPHALRRGRRLRTRRRVGIVVGAIAASAVVALVLPAALGGGSTTVIDPAGEPSSAATQSAPTDEATPYVRPAGWWDMPAADMVSALEAILPDEVTVTSPGPLEADTPEGGPGKGWIAPVIAGPAGPGRSNVMLYPVPALPSTANGTTTPTPLDGEADRLSCNEEFSGRTQCEQLTDADGSITGRRLVVRSGRLVTNVVTLRRNGGIVHAEASNSIDDKPGRGSPISADVPPLTLDQLEDLVRNDTWVMPAT